MFAVQTDVTREIVASLVSYVQQSRIRPAVADGRPNSLQAYELVLQGRERFQEKTPTRDAIEAAQCLVPRAVGLTPAYAAARANLGLTYIVETWTIRMTMARRARELEEGSPRRARRSGSQPDLPLAYQVLSYGFPPEATSPAACARRSAR